MLPGDFFLVRLHPHDFRSLVLFEDEGYEVRDRITHYNRDFTEDFWVLRSPPDGNIVNNVMKHGVGGINIDGCRIKSGKRQLLKRGLPITTMGNCYRDGLLTSKETGETTLGRWPTHVVLSHNEDCGDECSDGCVVQSLEAHSRQQGVRSHMKRSEDVETEAASRFFFCGTIPDVYQWLGRLLSRPRLPSKIP